MTPVPRYKDPVAPYLSVTPRLQRTPPYPNNQRTYTDLKSPYPESFGYLKGHAAALRKG